MSTYRLCVFGALLLGACSASPTRQSSKAAVVPVAHISTPAPAAMPPPVASPPAQVVAAHAAPAPVPALSPAVHHAIRKMPVAQKPAAITPAASAPATLQLSGHVVLLGTGGQQVVAGEQADTLVYFVPAGGGGRARPGRYTVYTHNRDFSPEAMAVPQGSTVTFVNLDDVRHNVFSVTPGAAFDLGYQGSGEKAAHAFTRAGVVLVSCNVHHSMELDLLVVPTSHVSKVAADGSFNLGGLPAGAGTLHFWNPRAQPVSQPVTLPMTGAVTQQLLAIRPRLTTDLNAGARP